MLVVRNTDSLSPWIRCRMLVGQRTQGTANDGTAIPRRFQARIVPEQARSSRDHAGSTRGGPIVRSTQRA